MRANDFRRPGHALLLAGCIGLSACNGSIGAHEPASAGGTPPVGGGGPTKVDPGKVTAPTTPFDAKTAFYATSKVKNLLTGHARHRRRRREGDDEGARPRCRS